MDSQEASSCALRLGVATISASRRSYVWAHIPGAIACCIRQVCLEVANIGPHPVDIGHGKHSAAKRGRVWSDPPQLKPSRADLGQHRDRLWSASPQVWPMSANQCCVWPLFRSDVPSGFVQLRGGVGQLWTHVRCASRRFRGPHLPPPRLWLPRRVGPNESQCSRARPGPPRRKDQERISKEAEDGPRPLPAITPKKSCQVLRRGLPVGLIGISPQTGELMWAGGVKLGWTTRHCASTVERGLRCRGASNSNMRCKTHGLHCRPAGRSWRAWDPHMLTSTGSCVSFLSRSF